jgi:hypothetical protein
VSLRRLVGTRRIVVVAVLVVAVLSGPAAMALGGCAAMAATACEGPCALVWSDPLISTGEPAPFSVAYLTPSPTAGTPGGVLPVPERPPKDPSLPA